MSAAIVSPARRGALGVLRSSLGWIVLLILLLIWQVAATAAPAASVASFSTSVSAFFDIVTGPSLTADVLPSIARVLLGFAVAGVAGVVVGLVLGSLPALDPWVHPTISFFRSIPPALIIPVAMVVLGLGPQLVVSVIVFGAFWPVLLNTFDGARRVEPLYRDVARVAHVPRTTLLLRVILPASLPSILAGLRIALSVSVIVMVVAEVLASTDGLGFLMSYAQQTFDVPTTYAAVILLALLGWVLDTAFVAVERRLLRWHPAFRKKNHA
ncbi:ABC transporter permease [Microbacterium sp. RD1]|uniref:ABC transporter permease n=1 Tax=Microbacterium sp. RD1 TaxID=3457313 RepID=UPI003FA5B928